MARLGEHWDFWASPVELTGFAVLLMGTLLYSQGCSAVARDAQVIVKDIQGVYRALTETDPSVYVADEDEVTSPRTQLATLSTQPTGIEASPRPTGSEDGGEELSVAGSMAIPRTSPNQDIPLNLNSYVPRARLRRDDSRMSAANGGSPVGRTTSMFGGMSAAGSFMGRLTRFGGAQSMPVQQQRWQDECRAVVQSGVLDAMAAAPAEADVNGLPQTASLPGGEAKSRLARMSVPVTPLHERGDSGAQNLANCYAALTCANNCDMCT